MEGEDHSVDDYAHHDEKLDILALSDEKKRLTVFIVGHFHPVLRLSLQNIETIFDPLFLFLGQVEILAVKFTLSVVLRDNYAHEKVQQEEIPHNDDEGKEEA